MELEIGRVIEACGARVLVEPASREAVAVGLTWDSREVRAGFVYAAIVGERVDGHTFAACAIEAGAVAVLCTRELDDDALEAARAAGACVLMVADVAIAIAEIAAAWRAKLGAMVIGVTGSVGKTTTKGLVRDILSTKYETWATKGNFNNELGAPYTVLTAPETALHYHDVFKRAEDGKIFRVTSESPRRCTPESAAFRAAWVTAEDWRLI